MVLELFPERDLECDEDSIDTLLRGYLRKVMVTCKISNVVMHSMVIVYVDSLCNCPWFVGGFCNLPSSYERGVCFGTVLCIIFLSASL